MVLESIFPVKKVVRNPLDMFILAAIISFASVFLAHMIFPGVSTGKIVTLFITCAMAPVVYGVFREEEEIEREEAEHRIHKKFFDRHDEALKIFSMFFLGVFASLFLISIVFPEDYVTSTF